jgi:hypothetical protein
MIPVSHLRQKSKMNIAHEIDQWCSRSKMDLNQDAVAINNIDINFEGYVTQTEKISAIYYYIVNDFINKASNDIAIDSKASALTACRILNVLGIPNVIIVGDDLCGHHVWNMVQIDSKWYHLDATWGDTTHETFNHFLVSDEILGVTHNWELERYQDVQ